MSKFITRGKKKKGKGKTKKEAAILSEQTQKELDKKRAFLKANNLRISPKTLALSSYKIQTVIDRLNNFGVDTQNIGFTMPAVSVIKISENENWLKERQKILRDDGVNANIENIINVPKKAVIGKILKEQIKNSVNPLSAQAQKWVETNIAKERRNKTFDASLQIFAGGGALSDAKSAADAGFISAAVEQAQTKPSAAKRLTPNTLTPYEYKGKKYNVKVEHYALQDQNVMRITAIVKLSPALVKAIDNKEEQNRIEKEIYGLSIREFALDIERDKKQMQSSLGVSGVGMIVYSGMDMPSYNKPERLTAAFLELSGKDRERYFGQEELKLADVGLLNAQIAAKKDYGAAEQMPLFEFGVMINAEAANVLSKPESAFRYFNNEKSKNVSIARVSSAKLKGIIERLWAEKVKWEKAADGQEINRVRNALNSGKEIRKIADLKASDLIENGRVDRNIIRHAYEAGFDGIYADLSELSREDAEKALEAIKEISARYAAQAQNYVSLKNNIKGDFIKGFTRIVKVFGEKISAAEVKKALDDAGDYEGSALAIEIEGISSGKEFEKAHGKISAAFMKNTSAISKNSSGAAKADAKKRYNASYKKALNSDYILNIETDKIKLLKEFMTEGGTTDFDGMKKALENAGITKNSAAYQYVEHAEKTNAAESYALAKGYLRASVENYLERQYLEAIKKSDRNEYLNSVGISDRNAIRGLMLYMALNGENLNAKKTEALLEEQKSALNGDKTLFALRADNNVLINEILADPFANDSKEKTAKAKQALTAVSESIASLSAGKAMETFKNGTFVSTQTIKQILSAA